MAALDDDLDNLDELWEVAVDAPLPYLLTYRVPSSIFTAPAPVPAPTPASPEEVDGTKAAVCETGKSLRGSSVRVPLGKGNRSVHGVLIRRTQSSEFEIKDILHFDTERPKLPEVFLSWTEWLADYYMHPLGLILSSCFPPSNKSKKQKLLPQLDPQLQQPLVTRPILSDEQRQSIEGIEKTLGQFAVHLLHGVTGSGKTEVYLHLIEQVIAQGKTALFLVPEISLTPQLTQRFKERLGEAVGVIHSDLTPRDKTNQWWSMVDQQKKVLIGARSALFCPFDSLSLIIIDEEHEVSFKQDETLKYHARDAAVMRAKLLGCPIVLGSATPSLESWVNVQQGRYHLHEMTRRVADRPLPDIEIIDLKQEREEKVRELAQNSANKKDDLPFWLSRKLFTEIKDTLRSGAQAALFLNRRGVAQSVVCPACGYVPECPHCAVSLTLHGRSHLICHYCNHKSVWVDVCPDCLEPERPRPLGVGTEKIERDLQELFPEARLLRMDRDEINSRSELEDAIRKIEVGEVDLIVGTQMIAKGLDFPKLILVGLVLADVSFNLPDFRAGERAFQLVTQVAGRSGRHVQDLPGRVIIQTYNSKHPSLLYSIQHDFKGFAEYELDFRDRLHYPPYWRLAVLRLQGSDLERVAQAAAQIKQMAIALRGDHDRDSEIEILGPAPCPLSKLRTQYRYHLLIKAPNSQLLGLFCRSLIEGFKGKGDEVFTGVRLSVDRDAFHLL